MPVKQTVRQLTNFTTVSNEIIRDLCGNPESLAMFMVMAAVPQDWEFHKSWLMNTLNIGETKYRNARDILVKKGYWTNANGFDANGNLIGKVIWINVDPPSMRNTPSVHSDHLVEIPSEQNTNLVKQSPLLNKQKDTNNKTDSNRETTPSGMVIPTAQEVQDYAASRGEPLFDADYFISYYGKKGWKIKSGVFMSDWKRAVLTWLRNDTNRQTSKVSASTVEPVPEFLIGLAVSDTQDNTPDFLR